MHAVLGAGAPTINAAWNDSFKIEGLLSVDRTWPWRMKPTDNGNSGLYTQAVVPWLR
jgi:hypothetical protein